MSDEPTFNDDDTVAHIKEYVARKRSMVHGEAALTDELAIVRRTTVKGGRNTQLNLSAWSMGQLVATGALDRDRVERELLLAATESGYVTDDGERQARATIESGLSAGMRKPRYPKDIGTVGRESFTATIEVSDTRFWESRESLRNIRDHALACMVSPWALLGVLLVYALDMVPYSVGLPGIADDDSPGSLNLFVALVGPSGANKGRTCKVARNYLRRNEFDIPPGSGEGLVKLYVRRPTDRELKAASDITECGPVIESIGGDQFVYKRRNVVLDCAEVDSLAALGNRSGATLSAVLRQGFSGETLGFGYADDLKRLLVPADQYRLGMLVGVQPERSGPLLDDPSGGTPQRFLWLPATDSRIRRHGRPNKSDTLAIGSGRPWPRILDTCQRAREDIESAAEERARGIGDPLDGHALFVRLKVAAALAVLDGRMAITESDWTLAGHAMAVSDLTRESCVRALAMAAERATEARGRSDGIRASIAEDVTTQRAVARVADVLVRAARKHGPMTVGLLRSAAAAGVRLAVRAGPAVRTVPRRGRRRPADHLSPAHRKHHPCRPGGRAGTQAGCRDAGRAKDGHVSGDRRDGAVLAAAAR